MKKLFLIPCVILLLTGCGNKEKQLYERAQELCQYVPDHKLLPEAEKYMTPDFYQALADAFNAKPDDPMDNEWLYYFVTGNGGSTPVYTIDSVKKQDDAHAIAYVSVQQKWDDGTISEEAPKQHQMEMTLMQNQWLMSDFDGKKQECLDWVSELNRNHATELAAINCYLTNEIGMNYAQGQVCIPCGTIIATDKSNPDDILVWGDFWVFHYNIEGDVLKTVSGGSHPGLMHVRKNGDRYDVISFEQTEDGAGNLRSAKRIFGDHFEDFWKVNSDEQVREAERKATTAKYVREHDLPVTCYQDYGWPAVKLQ